MLIYVFLLAILFLAGISTSKQGNFDAMDKDTATCVKSIFAVIIMFSHVRGYITLGTGPLDQYYQVLLNYLDQTMVAPFFFYSGYGIIVSLKNKPNYLDGFLKKRVLKTWLRMVFSLLLFWVMNLYLGIEYSAHDYLWSWTGLTMIGNSNWFVTNILLMYIATFIVANILEKLKVNKNVECILVTVLIFVAALAWCLSRRSLGKGVWWYDTLFCYPAGMMFALLKNKYDKMVSRPFGYILALALSIAVYVYGHEYIDANRLIAFNILSIAFCVAIALVTTKIHLKSKALNFLGNISLEIYLVQRIPMIVLHELGMTNAYLLSGLSFVIAIILAALCHKVFSVSCFGK